MKIISKFWDFYDSVGPYDETEPVYIRQPEYLRHRWREYSEKYKQYAVVSNPYDESIEQALLEFVRQTVPAHKWSTPTVPYGIYIGIFPNIYIIPVSIAYECKPWQSPGVIELNQLAIKENTDKRYQAFFDLKCVTSPRVRRLFYDMHAPVFAWSSHKNYLYDKKKCEYDDVKSWGLIINPVIQNLTPGVLNFLELDALNVYNNIESFLWSEKAEKISEPSNDTKIQSHGFDLKSSFRNVK